MPHSNPFNGVICPAITFFNENFEINNELNSLLYRHIQLNGANAIFLLGTTGEGRYFSNEVEEKIKLVSLAYDTCEEKIPILVGVFGNEPNDIINEMEIFGKKFKNLSFVIPPPMLETKDAASLKMYYETILGSFSYKNNIILYNNPKLYANNNISPEILNDLIKHTNLIGIKDSSEKIGNYKGYIRHLDENFTVCCGKERKFSHFLQLVPQELRRFSCLIPSISNIVNICSKLFTAAIEGDTLKIVQLQEDLDQFRDKIYDTKLKIGKQQRGLKYAFYSLYGAHTTTTINQEYFVVSPDFRHSLEEFAKERIDATIRYLINMNYIDRYYPINQKFFSFEEFKKIFSKIDDLKDIGILKRIKGPYGRKINFIYRMKFNNDLVVRYHSSNNISGSSICYEKILFPFLDSSLNKDTPGLRKKIKEIITTQKGSYFFGNQRPSNIPVGDLIFFDETREHFPNIYTIQEYIQGKPLYFHLKTQTTDFLEVEKLKFINFFKKLGNILGKLHEIKFDSHYWEIEDIGKIQARSTWHDIFYKELNTHIQDAKKYKVDFIEEISNYYKDNESLLEEEEAVLIHNDFQENNIIVKEEPGELHINGLINFDHWRIGARAQDFIKLEYFTVDPLSIPDFKQAFYEGYGELCKEAGSNEFKKKVEMHKLKWLLEEFNNSPSNLDILDRIKKIMSS